jgi:hypothetical protein
MKTISNPLHSIIGIITIPGMMTGALLGGSSVHQAAILQMIIMFMISASTALACIVAVVLCFSIVIDAEHRVRNERIQGEKHAIWRGKDWLIERITASGKRTAQNMLRLRRGEPDGSLRLPE